LAMTDCGLRISDCGLAIRDCPASGCPAPPNVLASAPHPQTATTGQCRVSRGEARFFMEGKNA